MAKHAGAGRVCWVMGRLEHRREPEAIVDDGGIRPAMASFEMRVARVVGPLHSSVSRDDAPCPAVPVSKPPARHRRRRPASGLDSPGNTTGVFYASSQPGVNTPGLRPRTAGKGRERPSAYHRAKSSTGVRDALALRDSLALSAAFPARRTASTAPPRDWPGSQNRCPGNRHPRRRWPW